MNVWCRWISEHLCRQMQTLSYDREVNEIQLDSGHSGADVVLVKNGCRICGTGCSLANCPIVQNKAYFEVKVQCTGVWCIGLALGNCNLDNVPLGTDELSWALRQDGIVYHSNRAVARMTQPPNEGDVVGVLYDHVALEFLVNGLPVDCVVHSVKGIVFPILCVDSGAILDVYFSKFFHEPPEGYDRIIMEKSLI